MICSKILIIYKKRLPTIIGSNAYKRWKSFSFIIEVVRTILTCCPNRICFLLELYASPSAQQLLCACISAVMRMHNRCCALVAQLMCSH